MELGIARAAGAIAFSVVIGLLMHLIFIREEREKAQEASPTLKGDGERSIGKTAIYFALMIGILVFANWGKPGEPEGLWEQIYSAKWMITGLLAVLFGVALVSWFGLKWWKVTFGGLGVLVLALLFPGKPEVPFSAGIVALSLATVSTEGEPQDWFTESWGFAKQITPLLFIGVLIAGLLLGRPGAEGLIPEDWIAWALGGNSIKANLFASVAGAFMYFATLTEVPIVQGLLGSGMGKGPALALLLAGPALSLPNMLVIRSVMGTKKTLVFISLVCVMATISGLLFGAVVD